MKFDEFKRWFNKDFWRAFKKRTFPIYIPATNAEREKLIQDVFESIESARYSASIPEAEIVMNKGCGVARTVPVFCIQDYMVFYFCIKELEDVLCVNRTVNTFGGWSLGGKIRKMEEIDLELDSGFSTARYSFNPRAWTSAFGEFNSLLFAQLDPRKYSHVLQFDLSNFYDCVRLDILERWIREEADSSKGWVIALLFYFLNQWNRKNTGLHPQGVGLPQDALSDCSRILANFYLQKYDKFAATICVRSEVLYFRYADDQMLLLSDPSKVDQLMLLLTRKLDSYGLRVNQKKVYLWTNRQLIGNRCRKLQSIFAKKGDNQDKALVRKFVDGYLAMTTEKLGKTWNGGMPLLNRLLWANLESLPKRLFEGLLVRFTSDAYLLLADSEKLVRVHALNEMRRRPVDLPKRLSELGEKSFHNSFHFEVFNYARSAKNKALEAAFEARIAQLREFMARNMVT